LKASPEIRNIQSFPPPSLVQGRLLAPSIYELRADRRHFASLKRLESRHAVFSRLITVDNSSPTPLALLCNENLGRPRARVSKMFSNRPWQSKHMHACSMHTFQAKDSRKLGHASSRHLPFLHQASVEATELKLKSPQNGNGCIIISSPLILALTDLLSRLPRHEHDW